MAVVLTVPGQTASSGQGTDACIKAIELKYKPIKDGLRKKYYYTKPYTGVAFAHECWSGEEVCIKHNSRKCCICPELYRKEYDNIESRQSSEVQKCYEQGRKETENKAGTASTPDANVSKTATVNSTSTVSADQLNNKVTASQQVLPSAAKGSNYQAQQQNIQNLEKTKEYANSMVGLPQTQSLNQSIRDFGAALQNYQASRQRDAENRENRRVQQNQNAANYINCELDRVTNKYFMTEYPYKFSCMEELEPSMKTSASSTMGNVKGYIDSINLYYQGNNYSEGIALLYDKRIKSILENNFLDVSPVTRTLDDMYVLVHYTTLYNYSYKEKKELEKQLAKGLYSSPQLLGVGVASLFKQKNIEYASFCFTELLKQNSPAYFKKIAALFLGVIKKKQGIDNNSNDLLNEAIYLLDKAYSIPQSEFLNIQDSYSNGKYTDNYSGLFVYPQYNQLLQLAIIQEIAHAFSYKYTLTNNQLYLQDAFDYYYNFPASIAKTGDENKPLLLNEKIQKNANELYNKALQNEKNNNLTEAFKFYLQAAELGDADAQASVGDAYADGIGIEKDFSKAVEWYQKSAQQGNAGGYFGLSGQYYFGEGVEKSVKDAISWALKASERGHGGAKYFLGKMYENGEGVQKDRRQAMLWYLKSAGQGYEKAKVKLQEMEKK